MIINKAQTLNTAYKKAFKFRFYPDSEQRLLLEHYFGSTRFVYNHTLSYSIKHYSQKEHKITDNYGNLIIIKNTEFKPLSGNDRINYLIDLKIDFPWLKEISSIALQQSVIHLNNAYSNFFKRVKSVAGQLGFPQFKKKANRNSFKIVGKNSIHFNDNGSFTLPKFKKPLDIRFSREFDRDKVSSVTVSKEPNGHYFISFLSEDNYKRLSSINNKIAFDSGIKNNLTVFDGDETSIFNLPSLGKLLGRIKFLQKQLSTKVKGSSNRNKTRIKLARLHAKRENVVNDYYHKISSKIVNENQVIIAEDLSFISMKEHKSKGKTVRRSLQHISLSKIYQYMEYKAKWYGKTLIKADRYYPSSKLCSTINCEYINHELTLSDRTWTCPSCNKVHDRDNNAMLNLYHYTEDNAKKAIDVVLSHHKNKFNNSILKDNKKTAKIEINKNLQLSKLTPT